MSQVGDTRSTATGSSARVGYTRVPTVSQTLDQQNAALEAAGVTKTFSDTMSGARDDRPGLAELMAYIREGDTVVVWKLDRLGRNMLHILQTVKQLAQPGFVTPQDQDPWPKATPDGNDEGMTHTAPSPSIAHPDPARWLWCTFGGRLESRYSGWVLRDTTTRTRWLRQAVRGGVPRGQRRRAVAAQRRYRRFMGLALTSGPLLVAGVVWASPAQADAASYLNDMHNVGIHDFDGDAALLQVGQKVCDETWYGYPPDELAAMALQRSDTIRGAHGLTPQQATEFVYYAKADLCPNY